MTARLMRNTAFRLVSSTASHSSSFMRKARLSRVMPALFTRICSPPCSLMIVSIKACAAAASLTFRSLPLQPGKAERVCPILAAPSSVVAVPITLSPRFASASAIAAPMPRDAPVTRATCPSNTTSLMRSPRKHVFYIRQTGWIEQRHAIQFRINAFYQASKHLARAAFDDGRQATRLDGLHTLHPAHRPKSLPVKCITNAFRIHLHRNVNVIDQGNLGWRELDRGQFHFELLRRWSHQTCMKRGRYRQPQHPLGTLGLQY